MHKQFLFLALTVMLIFFPFQPAWPAIERTNSNDVNLPTVLDDDIFNDLPFEQRRQALREEVERGPKRVLPSRDPQKYNFFIR